MNNDNVVHLPGGTGFTREAATPQAATVELLRRMLNDAEAGRLTGIVGVSLLEGGGVGSFGVVSQMSESEAVKLLGALNVHTFSIASRLATRA